MKIVLLTGSRLWVDGFAIAAVLNDCDWLIVGDCPEGADRIASIYMDRLERDYQVNFFRAFDGSYGKWPGAGPRRNAAMVRFGAQVHAAYPDREFQAHAFLKTGAKNRGTSGTVKLIKAAGLLLTEHWS